MKATRQFAGYPEGNSLADQLKIVALLITSGLKTRIYMVNPGGFDTHAQKVNAAAKVTGNHANLLQKASEGIKALMSDLDFLGAQKRIIGMIFSEFDRQYTRLQNNAFNRSGPCYC